MGEAIPYDAKQNIIAVNKLINMNQKCSPLCLLYQAVSAWDTALNLCC